MKENKAGLKLASEDMKQNSAIEDPDKAMKLEFLQSVIDMCHEDIDLILADKEPEPKTILVSNHYENGSQTKIMQNATLRHMCNSTEALMTKLPPEVRFGFLMDSLKEMTGAKDA